MPTLNITIYKVKHIFCHSLFRCSHVSQSPLLENDQRHACNNPSLHVALHHHVSDYFPNLHVLSCFISQLWHGGVSKL